jgi:hypothetical protein
MSRKQHQQPTRDSAKPRHSSSKSKASTPQPPSPVAPSPPRKTLPLFPPVKRQKVPRMALTLKPETVAAIAEIAALQKRPRSTVAADLLDEMGPTLTRLAAVLRTAAEASAHFPKASVDKLDRMVEALAMTAEGAMSNMEQAVEGAANAQARGRRAVRRRGH